MDDFDFGDFLGDITSGLDLSGGDTSWLDNFDWGSALDNLDFSNLDLSSVIGDVGAGGLDALLNNLEGFDLETADQVYGGSDLGTGLSYYPGEGYGAGTAGGMGGSEGLIGDTSDIFGADTGAGTVVISGERDNSLDGFDQETADQVYAGSDLGTGLSYYPGAGYGTGDAGGMAGAEDLIGDKDDIFGGGDGAGTIVVTGKQDDDVKSILDDEEHVRTDVDVDKDKDVTSILTDEEHTRQFDEDSFLNKILKAITAKDNQMLMALLGGLAGLATRNRGTSYKTYEGGPKRYMSARGPMGTGTRFTRVAAEGGLMGLAAGGKARPARYLAGGTDGMADKIQTDIDGEQPARLSHGEFVIPADVVSHLGNGNSDAGAEVLYDMMAKVRKARTGNPKQGKQINPRKYTPA